ncbi:hypothetical protein BGZ99_006919 [Dissophora globulifera]|uniref:C2H2-type domain-containing protein n=1 Tax=Dissophora globulifera TaxID=979702 RepID=A0A9P6URD5_9FUNG|nr:hypothetical protein BGZ99_006919 [Dissophora globulifera]
MSLKCRFCKSPDFRSARSLRSHISLIHDGGERLGPLHCTFVGCQSEYHSRTRFQQHLASHCNKDDNEGEVNDRDQGGNGDQDGNEDQSGTRDQEVNEDSKESNRYMCSTCQKVYISLEDFDTHLNGHEEIALDNCLQNTLEDEDEAALLEITSELTEIIKNKEVVELMLTWVEPSVCIHESGERTMAMLTPSSTKRLLDDPIVEVQPMKRRAKGVDTDPIDLKLALTGHRLGSLLETSCYEPVEPFLYLADFSTRAGEIAKTFAGALLQWESTAVLLLKVEVYGRSPSEDVHGFDLAKPSWDLKTVAVITHDHTRKLLIGTLSFSVLVTAALNITTGDISVGASTALHISNKTRLWRRKDWLLNPLVERQLRSKFDHAITFAKTAAVFYLFASWECQPVTIFRLLDHYRGKSSSGTKAVAILFNEIGRTQSITKQLLQDLLADIGTGSCSVTTTLQAVLASFKEDEQERPLSKDQKTSRLLRSLADGVCGTIRSLNNDKVATAIKARSEALLQDKPCCQH